MKVVPLPVTVVLLSLSMAVHAQQESSLTDATEATSEAERIVRLQSLIESDQERLAKLIEELKEREMATETAARELSEREQNLEAMKAQLDAAHGTEEKAKLQDKIDSYRDKFEVAKNLTNAALQAEKNIRSQIQAMEEKIVLDQEALDEMLGTTEALVPAAPQATSQQEQETQQVPGEPDQPHQLLEEVLPETPEQIEARQRAERTEVEAEQAEQAVMSFLERKAALQEQIDLEKSLLATAKETRASLEQSEQIRRKEYTDKVAAGAGEPETARMQAKLASIESSQRDTEQDIAHHENRLESLHQRMLELQEEQLALTAEAEYMRQEAESAQRRSAWLDSPLNPRNIARWGMERGPDMLTVILVSVVLLVLVRRFLQRVARVLVRGGRRKGRNANTRADTLAFSFGNAATIIIIIVGLLLIFEAAGVNLTTILGGAAILGFAFAFGAQNLMRDYFNGLIILIEDQYELNDIVTINDTTGRVERVSLRTTALRDLQGQLHFIPNGEIKSVTNRSYEWAQIVFDIRVSYKENPDRVMEEILTVAREVCAEPEYKDAVIEAPVMLGVDQFGDFGFTIKCLVKTLPGDLYRVRREILRRIKNRFDELGIVIPVPVAAAVPKV